MLLRYAALLVGILGILYYNNEVPVKPLNLKFVSFIPATWTVEYKASGVRNVSFPSESWLVPQKMYTAALYVTTRVNLTCSWWWWGYPHIEIGVVVNSKSMPLNIQIPVTQTGVHQTTHNIQGNVPLHPGDRVWLELRYFQPWGSNCTVNILASASLEVGTLQRRISKTDGP